jgi:hypothetical protein
MDVVTLHALQTVASNPGQKPYRCAVIQEFRWNLWLIPQIHRNRMSLICTNASAIFTERKPLFVARGNDVCELVECE